MLFQFCTAVPAELAAEPVRLRPRIEDESSEEERKTPSPHLCMFDRELLDG